MKLTPIDLSPNTRKFYVGPACKNEKKACFCIRASIIIHNNDLFLCFVLFCTFTIKDTLHIVKIVLLFQFACGSEHNIAINGPVAVHWNTAGVNSLV